MKLTDRHPQLDATALVARFAPPPRFADATFATYVPDPAHPSQRAALDAMHAYAAAETSAGKRRFFARTKPTTAHGLYLDGGFGVGKTHLLAALWHASTASKAHAAYATFTELTAFIGFLGMSKATAAFAKFDLICIDEFELDDVANTLMVVSFLRALSEKRSENRTAGHRALRMAVTSNTLPDRLGEQRFNAGDFKREIAAIASYFDELKIDGPDFRATPHPTALSAGKTVANAGGGLRTNDTFDELLGHLKTVHPVQYGALLDGVEEVTVSGIHTIDDEDQALLFVQLVDKLYDARIKVTLSGVAPELMFDQRFRFGGYRKKYGRAQSRASAMNAESA